MYHVIFEENTQYDVAILVKESALRREQLIKHYVSKMTLKEEDVIAFSLEYDGKRAPVSLIRKYLESLMKSLDALGVNTIYVCDGPYFKVLTKSKKADPFYGYILPCALEGYGHMNIVLGIGYQALFYNPDLQTKLDLSINALNTHHSGSFSELGSQIIHSSYYPEGLTEIQRVIESLHQYPELVVDVETFSLSVFEAGIGSIGFAWDEHNGTAFLVDYARIEPTKDEPLLLGVQTNNLAIKRMLTKFFETYKGKLTYHNQNFDSKILIFQLWMKQNPLDRVGLITGLGHMTRSHDDTKLIAYLAKNSTARISLSLKDLAHEFAGNYAQDNIKDIRKIEYRQLLKYNLTDCLATWFVKKKYEPVMIADDQLDTYNTIFKPSIKPILQMELIGMPMDMDKVKHADKVLTAVKVKQQGIIKNSPTIHNFTALLRKEAMVTANAKLVKKVHPLSHFDGLEYNPASDPQTRKLLYDFLGLPVIDLTKGKQAATGAKTIKKLIHHTKDQDVLDTLDALIALSEVTILLDNFINAFLHKTVLKADGVYYLHGNFNLGGTVSGRLSSSQVNLQNLPSSGNKYASLIKACFIAPPGFVLVGADFASLEDRISALTTKDPNKLKVYVGHNIYKLTINGACHDIRDDATINYDGRTYTGEEFYKAYSTL